jgi:hypothetical protein
LVQGFNLSGNINWAFMGSGSAAALVVAAMMAGMLLARWLADLPTLWRIATSMDQLET